jgi:hypothetical protein
VFFLVFGRIVHLKLSSLGKWSSLRVVGEIFLARSFTFFNLILEARSALPRQLLTDTRPLAAFFVVFLPCRRKIRLCWSLVIGAWCPSAWGLSAVWCACRPRAAFFFFFFFLADLTSNRSYGVGPLSGWHRCRRVKGRPTSWPISSTVGNLFWVVFASVSCVFSLFSWVTVCLC